MLLAAPLTSLRQHTPAYVSICQHNVTSCLSYYLVSAYANIRQHTSAYVSTMLLAASLTSLPDIAMLLAHRTRTDAAMLLAALSD